VFEVTEAPMPKCPAGGVLVRVLYAAVDPAMRGWLSSEKNYLTVPDGAVMRAEGVGEVLVSDHPDWRPGDFAYGTFGWQQYAAVSSGELRWRVDLAVAPAPVWLGSLGFNGLAAWIGLNYFSQPRPGETVLVSTAAGAVGSVVACLARAAGLEAVGLTGSPEKVDRCRQQLGYRAAVDYKASTDLQGDIANACPRGIDIFFDNTAGVIADAAFPALNRGARVIQCGTASIANWSPTPLGPRRERDMIVKRLSWRGFVVVDHLHLYPQALIDLEALYVAGRLDAQTEVLDGLDAAPGAIQRLYSGLNDGRLCIRP
jgi:NADPH-dependent curcumin reductase CurA